MDGRSWTQIPVCHRISHRRLHPAKRASTSFELSRKCIFAVLVATAATLSTSAVPASAADFYGYLQESIGVRTGPGDVIYHRQMLNTKVDADLSRDVSLRLEADLWRDDADFQEDGSLVRARIREGYAKLRFSKADLRLGRVQIAWGEADGVIVSDQVSPFDIENFIVAGFDQIRLGVDGVFLDYYFDSGNELQLLWIGRIQPYDFPERGSPWNFIDEDALAAQGLTLAEPDAPSGGLENSEFGVRFSGHPVSVDWAVGYLRSWDDRPSLRIRPPLVIPTYNRFDLFTGNVVWPVADILLKLDTAYEHGRFLSTDPTNPNALPTAADGFVAKQDVWRTLIGLDAKPRVPGWEQPNASFQFVHEEVIDPRRGLLGPKHTDLVSVLLMASNRNETIKPWLFAIVNVRDADTWIQAKVDYEPFDQWRFTIEYDFFDGRPFNGRSGGTFGQFSNNDLVQTTVRYSY